MYRILAERRFEANAAWEQDGKPHLYETLRSYNNGMNQLRGMRKPLTWRTDPDLNQIWTEFNLPRQQTFVSWRLVGYEFQVPKGEWVEFERFEGQ